MFLYTNGPHKQIPWLTVAAILDLCKLRPNGWPISLCPFLKWFRIKKIHKSAQFHAFNTKCTILCLNSSTIVITFERDSRVIQDKSSKVSNKLFSILSNRNLGHCGIKSAVSSLILLLETYRYLSFVKHTLNRKGFKDNTELWAISKLNRMPVRGVMLGIAERLLKERLTVANRRNPTK